MFRFNEFNEIHEVTEVSNENVKKEKVEFSKESLRKYDLLMGDDFLDD